MTLLSTITTGDQSDLAKAASNLPHTVKPHDSQTDRQSLQSSVTIVCISCIRCSLMIQTMLSNFFTVMLCVVLLAERDKKFNYSYTDDKKQSAKKKKGKQLFTEFLI